MCCIAFCWIYKAKERVVLSTKWVCFGITENFSSGHTMENSTRVWRRKESVLLLSRKGGNWRELWGFSLAAGMEWLLIGSEEIILHTGLCRLWWAPFSPNTHWASLLYLNEFSFIHFHTFLRKRSISTALWFFFFLFCLFFCFNSTLPGI